MSRPGSICVPWQVLLLGAGESGKSTFGKQLKMLTKGSLAEGEKVLYRKGVCERNSEREGEYIAQQTANQACSRAWLRRKGILCSSLTAHTHTHEERTERLHAIIAVRGTYIHHFSERVAKLKLGRDSRTQQQQRQ